MSITDKLDPLVLRKNDTKFEAKLTFDERCAVLALATIGVQRPVLAAAFHINRRTVSHIVNPQSIRYKDVRKELQGLGREAFIEKYVREEHVQMVNAAKGEAQATASVREYRDMPKQDVPNPRAKGKAGIHTVKPDHCAYTHRIEVKYLNEGDEGAVTTGWHIRDPDVKDQSWVHNGPESLLTSNNALKMAEPNILDD